MSGDRLRCEDYLRWVASLPCANCGREDVSQAHHFKGTGNMSGVALKAPDQWTMPLCFECHDALHRYGSKQLIQKQYEWTAKTLAQFVELVAEGLGDRSFRQLTRGVARTDVIGGRSL